MSNKKLAVIFPGQGSQKLGMLSDIAEHYPIIEETFALASKALGYDLWSVCQADEAKLNQTQYTQPALLTASVALWQIIKTKPIAPLFLAGHSLGEYSALVCANAISFTDAVQLVALRGKFMQLAVSPGVGAMAAILGLDDDIVIDICQQASAEQMVSAANFNSPGQVVIAGHAMAVDKAIKLATEKGARRAIMLPVSVPSHCQLMQPAAKQLAEVLKNQELKAPIIDVVHNVDVSAHKDISHICQALVAQLSQAVRWAETIKYLATQGITGAIECGPGKVLAGLNKRIDKAMLCQTVGNLTDLQTFLGTRA